MNNRSNAQIDRPLISSNISSTLNRTTNNIVSSTIQDIIMSSIVANQLKTQGIFLIESRLAVDDEVTVAVRGKGTYAVITLEKYAQLRDTS